jgi:FkbM family methyltransferase
MDLISRLRHSWVSSFARSGLSWIHRLKYRDGRPHRCVVTPSLEFLIYPNGELAEFISLAQMFERTELGLVAGLLKPGMKVIDAGANIGLYSLLAAKCVGERGQIWSFEPSQTTYRLLTENLSLNQVTTVQANRLALSDFQGELTLRSERGFGDLYRHLDYGGSAVAGDVTEKVGVSTLDDFAAEHEINEIDFLKIDVEGGEYRLLKGAQRLLAQSPNVTVMFESEEIWCKRSGCTTDDAFELLKSLGFRLYSWSKKQKQWSAIDSELGKDRTVWAAKNLDLLYHAAAPLCLLADQKLRLFDAVDERLELPRTAGVTHRRFTNQPCPALPVKVPAPTLEQTQVLPQLPSF